MRGTDEQTAIFQILDALDHPHGGTILRLRLQEGEAPSKRVLKKGRLRLTSPEGEARTVEVAGFADLGGKVSDERLARTGRVDVHAYSVDDAGPLPVLPGWTAHPAGSS